VLPLTPLGNSADSAAFTWGEFLLGKLRQLFATTRRHSPTAVSGPPGSGVVFPFTSFQGIFSSYDFLLWAYAIGSCQDLNPAEVVFVAFGLAGN
jgi:hypothetical protein